MQLVNTSRDSLLKPLQVVSGIVERRHTLPILANLLFKKQGDKVSFISTDIEIQITTNAGFGVGVEDVTTTAPLVPVIFVILPIVFPFVKYIYPSCAIKSFIQCVPVKLPIFAASQDAVLLVGS